MAEAKGLSNGSGTRCLYGRAGRGGSSKCDRAPQFDGRKNQVHDRALTGSVLYLRTKLPLCLAPLPYNRFSPAPPVRWLARVVRIIATQARALFLH